MNDLAAKKISLETVRCNSNPFVDTRIRRDVNLHWLSRKKRHEPGFSELNHALAEETRDSVRFLRTIRLPLFIVRCADKFFFFNRHQPSIKRRFLTSSSLFGDTFCSKITRNASPHFWLDLHDEKEFFFFLFFFHRRVRSCARRVSAWLLRTRSGIVKRILHLG